MTESTAAVPTSAPTLAAATASPLASMLANAVPLAAVTNARLIDPTLVPLNITCRLDALVMQYHTLLAERRVFAVGAAAAAEKALTAAAQEAKVRALEKAAANAAATAATPRDESGPKSPLSGEETTTEEAAGGNGASHDDTPEAYRAAAAEAADDCESVVVFEAPALEAPPLPASLVAKINDFFTEWDQLWLLISTMTQAASRGVSS